MKFTVSKSLPQTFRTDIIVIGCYEREPEDENDEIKRPALIKHADGGIALDKALGGALSKQIGIEKFTGEKGTGRLLFTAGKIPARFVLLIGLGPREKYDLEVLREAGAKIAAAAREAHATSVALVLERGPLGEDTAPARARAITEGVILGKYTFGRYKTGHDKEESSLELTTFLYQGDAAAVRASIEVGEIVAGATCLSRDLSNTPGLDMTPLILAKRAKDIAENSGLSCTVWGVDAIRKAKMNCLLAVAQGSAEPPTFTTLTHKFAGAKAHVVLVGKGVTFDAGGISLKPPRGMETMKEDMSGAACVLGTMEAVAKLNLPIQVTALIPATENLPDGKAIKPGDIITARNGKTVEIISTDAEGRLVLADALSFGADLKPDAMIDVATLTGGALYCCGELYSLIMGNDQKLVDRLRRASDAAGEQTWQLPIVEAYKKGYTSGIADLNNVGKGKAQTILGSIFLREFVGKTPWAHIDIAASSWAEEDFAVGPKGATGAMVRTLVSFLSCFKKNVPD